MYRNKCIHTNVQIKMDKDKWIKKKWIKTNGQRQMDRDKCIKTNV